MEKLYRIWLRVRDAMLAKDALLTYGDSLHDQARQEQNPAKAKRLRDDAESVNEVRHDIEEQIRGVAAVMPGASSNATGSHSTASTAAVHEGNTKLVPWLVLTAMLSGFSLAAAIFVLIEFAQMQNNQARMAVHIMSNDALLLREGVMKPGDQWAGPEGNLEYGPRDKPRK